MKKYLLILCLFLFSYTNYAQKLITLESIFKEHLFAPKALEDVYHCNDGEHYTELDDNQKIIQFAYKDANSKKILLNIADLNGIIPYIYTYQFSMDESKLLISTNIERIYRNSYQSNYYVYDIHKQTLFPVANNNKARLAEISPDNQTIAFTAANNLYIQNLETGAIHQITKDGENNKIINGSPDWVYEEEFEFTKAFWWSPDGKEIAYERFDESKVKEYSLTFYDELYPTTYTYKYPKAGEDNSLVSVNVYQLKKNKTIAINLNNYKDFYLPRVNWTSQSNKLCITKLNRLQNTEELLLVDTKDGNFSVILTEKNNRYLEVHNDLQFLKDGTHYLWRSEKDGWSHLYLNSLDGKESKLLTPGNYDVVDFLGLDETSKILYYSAAASSPLNIDLFSIPLYGMDKQQLNKNRGVNHAEFNKTFTYYINTFSNTDTLPTSSIISLKNDFTFKLEKGKNDTLNTLFKEYNFGKKELFSFKTSEAITLNGYIIKPKDFDPAKKYPVFMSVYGGPNHQEVFNNWGDHNFAWFNYLAQKGYIVVCVDGRGTGSRGEEFRKSTYKNLGKLETIDQIETAKYLGSLDYVDKSRIGIFGWSYGGYISTSCILKGADVFKLAIAVAPVTNWKFYDNIYTERYMQRPIDNPDGYTNNAPNSFTDKLKGKFLLIHGMADDNVHLQNSTELIKSLVANNKQFDQFLYPDCNHGIYTGKNTRINLYQKMTDYILNNL